MKRISALNLFENLNWLWKFHGGFNCPVCPPTLVAGLIQFTRAYPLRPATRPHKRWVQLMWRTGGHKSHTGASTSKFKVETGNCEQSFYCCNFICTILCKLIDYRCCVTFAEFPMCLFSLATTRRHCLIILCLWLVVNAILAIRYAFLCDWRWSF